MLRQTPTNTITLTEQWKLTTFSVLCSQPAAVCRDGCGYSLVAVAAAAGVLPNCRIALRCATTTGRTLHTAAFSCCDKVTYKFLQEAQLPQR